MSISNEALEVYRRTFLKSGDDVFMHRSFAVGLLDTIAEERQKNARLCQALAHGSEDTNAVLSRVAQLVEVPYDVLEVEREADDGVTEIDRVAVIRTSALLAALNGTEGGEAGV